MDSLRHEFIEFALASKVLAFGEFKTKAGRLSPYFFNAGLFNRGATLGRLARFYAQTLLAARAQGRVEFDMLFGPAYKGITLVSATAVALADLGVDVPFAFNRKEAKDHGEGGLVVGAPLVGKVVIVDDVITDGAAKRESVELIRAQGARPVAVLIALDRVERAGVKSESGATLSSQSAVQAFEQEFGIPVIAIASFSDLMQFLDSDSPLARDARAFRSAMEQYRANYGA
ncbi:MAG TPA: orotate phosphoribosyltransferase [Burkholderiaceae bacterium]|nr:orotate phosphoribosyltransferase [Burkholderiaceae bacterium]